MSYNYNYKTEALTSMIRELKDYQIVEIINEYNGDDETNVYFLDSEFDDFCERFLTYTDVANAVHDGDFHTWHSFFRYDSGRNEFTSGDDITDVFDYTDDDRFAEWLCGGDFDFDKYGIKMDDLIEEFCSYYELDKDKLVNHPNWEEDAILNEDWDEILECLEIDESEVSIYDEDEDENNENEE